MAVMVKNKFSAKTCVPYFPFTNVDKYYGLYTPHQCWLYKSWIYDICNYTNPSAHKKARNTTKTKEN